MGAAAVEQRLSFRPFAWASRMVRERKVGKALRTAGYWTVGAVAALCFLLPEPALTKSMGFVLVSMLQAGLITTGAGIAVGAAEKFL